MYSKKKSYLCGGFMRIRVSKVKTVTSNRIILLSIMALAMCLLVPVFSYAQAQHVSLGANYSNATNIIDTVTANVVDGDENYFKLEAAHLPATVCYFPDTAFGPVPALIYIDDTLSAVMVSENCRMGWRWELPAAGEEETVRTLYFSAHENNAIAEIRPFVCQPITTTAESEKACGELTWGKLKIEETGTYTQTFIAANGCDSVVTKYVTIAQESDPTYIQITAYDKYTWYGVTYTQSRNHLIYQDTNIDGCDSIINLDLTIRYVHKDTIRTAVCANELPYLWQGRSLMEGGVFTTDTLLSTTSDTDTLHTLALTVNKTFAVDTTAELCGTSFAWRGQTYTKSGNYTFNGTTKAGCDSIVTLYLTLKAATASEETRSEYDSFTWNGKTYIESGTYTYNTTNAAGCDSVATLHLTILTSAVSYDTVYFCSGLNTEHEEKIDPTHIRRYLAYTYESPADWDYMDGVILAREHDRMQVDLRRAEQNLFNHYTDGLTPVKSIAWSYRPDGTTGYQALEVTSTPQWIATGTVAVTIRFVCGQLFTSDFATDITNVAEETNGRKVLIDGQIVIIRNGIKYNLLGSKIE